MRQALRQHRCLGRLSRVNSGGLRRRHGRYACGTRRRCTGSGTTCATRACSTDTFRADVLEIDQSLERMIWRIVSKFAELSDAPGDLSRSATYAVFDGLFQHALSRHLAGDPDAADVLGKTCSACWTRSSARADGQADQPIGQPGFARAWPELRLHHQARLVDGLELAGRDSLEQRHQRVWPLRVTRCPGRTSCCRCRRESGRSSASPSGPPWRLGSTAAEFRQNRATAEAGLQPEPGAHRREPASSPAACLVPGGPQVGRAGRGRGEPDRVRDRLAGRRPPRGPARSRAVPAASAARPRPLMSSRRPQCIRSQVPHRARARGRARR